MELSGETLLYISLFVVPGFVMNAAFSSIVPQRSTSEQSTLFRFIAFSFFNLTLWYWLFYDWFEEKLWIEHPVRWIIILFIFLVVVPYVLGFIAGIISSKEWLRSLVQKLGVNTVHPVPTAWDYTMRDANWVIVTLKDETMFYGLYGGDSLASSVPEERDIYLQKTYSRNRYGNWEPNERTKGVWIPKEEIKHIEFIEIVNGDEEDESTKQSAE